MASAENRWDILCGLEIILCPQTVLFKGMAEPVWLASEGQVRERGSTRPWGRLSPPDEEPEQGAKQRPGLGDPRPMRPLACSDAVAIEQSVRVIQAHPQRGQ